MIVPEFWAEGRVQQRLQGRQVTLRRFGWSDTSQDDAQRHADERAREALALLAAGQDVARRERKRAYNGAEGVPIREEILSRHDAAVVTRNLYGARCLNTPDVLFADIDFSVVLGPRLGLSVLVLLELGAAAIGWGCGSWVLGLMAAVAGLLFSHGIATHLLRLFVAIAGGAQERAQKRVRRFCAERPEWHVRVYRTPAGLRLLAMHRTFDPADAAVAECFRAVGADPVYVRMCRNQRCFRARVSPKPWRIGIGTHIRPRPGVWPVRPERRPERARWVEAYESSARGYASCRLLETLGGSAAVHPSARAVQLLHDELCQAHTMLPMA
jgi:hypothetical protein